MTDPFLQALADPSVLPQSVRDLHLGPGEYVGECDIERGQGILIQLALKLGRFPPAGRHVPVQLMIQTQGEGQNWLRDFGGHKTKSELRFDAKTGHVHERFGPLSVWMWPVASKRGLEVHIHRLTVFGVPLPRVLLPRSSTTEWQDELGRFRFDVVASTPGMGLLIRYHGWLTPVNIKAAAG